jgi:hypothetical protein
MRKAKVERNYGNYSTYIEEVKTGLAQSMTEGGIFIINIDDSDVKYDSLYDPDLKEFYSRSHFPSQIMHPSQFAIREVYSKVLLNTEFRGKPLSPDFRVSLYSRYVADLYLGGGMEQVQD